MQKLYDVLVVGDYCLDLIFTGMKSEPILGKEITATGFNMTPGGTCNSAITMHRLGLRVGWAADFGCDQFSQFILSQLEKEHFDLSLFVVHKKDLQLLTVSLSYPHERAFVAYYDQGPRLPAAFKMIPRVNATWIYIPGLLHGPQLEAGLSLIRSKRMKIAMDGNFWDRLSLKNRTVKRAIEVSDIFFANADEARSLTDEEDLERAVTSLGKHCPTVIVKAGSKGSFGCEDQHVEFMPAIKIKPLDTTGAGDCFNAGFLKATLLGLPLRDRLKWGNIVGGLSTLGRGGVDKITTVEDVQKWWRKLKA